MKKLLFVLVILTIFISCEKDSNTTTEPDTTQMGLKGFVQKGPFITGSTIDIQELNENLSPNGNSFNVTTEDNFGSFSLESEITTDFIEIISMGFYFNEVSGEITNTNLTLRSLSEVSDTLNCNINLLTTLAKKRIVYLMNEEIKTYTQAKQQGQGEILNLFRVYESGIADFEDMDISSSSESDAVLLAISSVLQGSNSVSELSSLISTMIEDIKTDGILDDIDSKNEIYNNAKNLNLSEIRQNIENRYSDLGLSLTVPNFEKYVDDIWKIQCRIISPLNNEQFDYNDSIIVNTDDFASDINIVNTKYYLDDELIFDDSEYPYSNSYKLQNLEFGNHQLKAVATDDNSSEYSDSINIIVATPAQFTLLSPVEGTRFNSGNAFNIEISDQPDYIHVTNVKYYFDGALIKEYNQKQLSFGYTLADPETSGSHIIKSSVTDETGRTTSDSLEIVINAPPSSEISKLESTQTLGLVTNSALTGQPLVIGTTALLQVNADDTDGIVKNISIFLDNKLVKSDTLSSLYNYNWVISDTTKYHSVKVIIEDNEGEHSVDSVNYELYGSRWIISGYPGPAGGDMQVNVFNGKLFYYNSLLGATAGSEDGVTWTVNNNSLPWNTGGSLLEYEYDRKLWLLKDMVLWSSSDGVNWNSQQMYGIQPESQLFMFNEDIYSLYKDMDIFEVKVCKFENDSIVNVSTTGRFFELSNEEIGIVTLNNGVYLIDEIYTKRTYVSPDCLDWSVEYGVPYYLQANGARFTEFNNEIVGANMLTKKMWRTNDSITWTEDYLIHPCEWRLRDIFVFNNEIWMLDEPGILYRLKKYFD